MSHDVQLPRDRKSSEWTTHVVRRRQAHHKGTVLHMQPAVVLDSVSKEAPITTAMLGPQQFFSLWNSLSNFGRTLTTHQQSKVGVLHTYLVGLQIGRQVVVPNARIVRHFATVVPLRIAQVVRIIITIIITILGDLTTVRRIIVIIILMGIVVRGQRLVRGTFRWQVSCLIMPLMETGLDLQFKERKRYNRMWQSHKGDIGILSVPQLLHQWHNVSTVLSHLELQITAVVEKGTKRVLVPRAKQNDVNVGHLQARFSTTKLHRVVVVDTRGARQQCDTVLRNWLRLCIGRIRQEHAGGMTHQLPRQVTATGSTANAQDTLVGK